MLKSVKNQVLDQVWDQVRVQVWDQVGDQVRGQVRDQVRDQVWVKSGIKSGSSRASSLGSEEGYFKMKTLIVLVFIAFGEPPKVIDVYQIQPGVYQTCKMKAKELNKSAVNGRWDCSLMKKEDLK
jgi:hypothetical protein